MIRKFYQDASGGGIKRQEAGSLDKTVSQFLIHPFSKYLLGVSFVSGTVLVMGIAHLPCGADTP